MRIIVASTNSTKIAAVQQGFSLVFPDLALLAEGVSAASGVTDQPKTDEETLKGAENRVENAIQLAPNGDYWAAIEGGCAPTRDGLSCFAWVAISNGRQVSRSRTAQFTIPPPIAKLVHGGMELSHACDHFFATQGTKNNLGAIGWLTGGVLDRVALFSPAVILALTPFVQAELYTTQ